ncbi:hypothetical protein Tco_0586624 [Tanacetum coccineum]
MSEEDQNVEVVPPVKSDMHSYSSTMTAKDVKALAFKHNIPLDLHPVALTAEWTMDKLTDDFIGLYEQYFEFSGVRVPFSTLLLAVLDHFRVHISQLVPIGLTRLTLFELYCIDIRPVPSNYFFMPGWPPLGSSLDFFQFSKIPRETLSRWSVSYEFPFRDAVLIEQGDALSARDAITQRTTGPLPVNQFLSKKTARLKEVEISDPKIVAIRERKARAAAKKRAERKRAADGEGGSEGRTKRRKKMLDDAGNCESREGRNMSGPLSRFSKTHPFIIMLQIMTRAFARSGGNTEENVETHHTDETRLTETPVPALNPEKTVVQDLVPVEIAPMELSPPILVLFSFEGPSSGVAVALLRKVRELLTHLAPHAVREEMNVYDNNTAMERAWFSIARGAMAQTDALLRFEALYDAHLALKERFRGEHAGYAEKLINAERERDELRAVNADQASHIKELEG